MQEDLKDIAQKHGIVLALKFGSSVTGRVHPKITDNCELLYGPPERLQALKLYAFKRYQDHGRFFEMERRFAERFLAATQAGR